MSAEQERRDIGARVREAVSARFGPARTQASVAGEIGMTADAYSRSLSGERAFSTAELARVADLSGADLRFLITGQADPLAVRIAARHEWDPVAREHHHPSRADDEQTLSDIALAYRQANPWRSSPPVALPSEPAKVREQLGEAFVATFAERAEQALGVDVIRIQGLGTDYSFTIAGRPVVLLRSEPHWFRSNWSLAHEIAHLALGHHLAEQESPAKVEAPANKFAQELLMPEQDMRGIDWASAEEPDLARMVWRLGVSTEALANRLRGLRLPVPRVLEARPEGSTMRLLRRQRSVLPTQYHPGTSFVIADPITFRFNSAAERRIPEPLVSAHLDGIAEGRLNKGTLAWLLEVDPEDIDVDEPEHEPVSGDELMAALGL